MSDTVQTGALVLFIALSGVHGLMGLGVYIFQKITPLQMALWTGFYALAMGALLAVRQDTIGIFIILSAMAIPAAIFGYYGTKIAYRKLAERESS